MNLAEFLLNVQSDVRSSATQGTAFAELAFSEVVMQHMADIGMTFEPVLCHYSGSFGNALLRLSGYALSDDNEQLDLFVSLYEGTDELRNVSDSETKRAAEQCLRFLSNCATGRMAGRLDESTDVYTLAQTIQFAYPKLEQIRIYVLTDLVAKAKQFRTREINSKAIRLEVVDIERLHRHWAEGKPRDEIIMDFAALCGGPLPCISVPGENEEFDLYLAAIPGEALRNVYERFGGRLLEANVRSFLNSTGKVNAGIRDTLKQTPERFVAYNNGIVLVADEARLDRAADGSPGLTWLGGVQIVNGGQTTASLYFTKRKSADINLNRVRVPAKVIVLKATTEADEETLISEISRYANSQNSVKQADLSANKPFHVELEKMANSVVCPDGVARWFYERAAGSYNVLLLREGTTPAALRRLKEAIPPSRRITKTDLARYLNTWARRPQIVSLGSQKNFQAFMESLAADEAAGRSPSISVQFFKRTVAKAIVFRESQRLLRPKFPAFQGNIITYTVALLADRLGPRVDLDRIWLEQGISEGLANALVDWAAEVSKALHDSGGGRMISEWAKKPECWDAVRAAVPPLEVSGIPEIRATGQ